MPRPCCAVASRWCIPTRIGQRRCKGQASSILTIREWALAAGEWFTSQEIDAASKVAVLGETVRAQLFGSVDPVGQVIQVGNVPFRVMGVLEAKGQSAWGQDQDDIILIPYTTMQKKVWKTTSIHSILAAAGSSALNCHRPSNRSLPCCASVTACSPGRKTIFLSSL